MEELCSSCLCTGRKLHYIFDTKFHDLYAHILTEIPAYTLSSQISIKICWECQSVLNKFQTFKRQAQNSFVELLSHLHQSTQPTPKESRLKSHHIFKINYPEIKLETSPLDDHRRTLNTFTNKNQTVSQFIEFENSNPTATNSIELEKNKIIYLIEKDSSILKNHANASEDLGLSCDETQDCVMNLDMKYDHCEETFVDEISAWGRKKRIKIEKKEKQKSRRVRRDEESDSESIPLKDYKNMVARTTLETSNNDELDTNTNHIQNNHIYLRNTTKKEECADDMKLENYVTDLILRTADLDGLSNCSDDNKDNNFDVDTTVCDIKKTRKKSKKKKPIKNQDFISIELSYEEMQAERQTDMLNKLYIDSEYKCTTCIMPLGNKQEFNLHMKSKHDPAVGEYKCPVCDTLVASFDAFSTHYNRHMKRYECSVCQKRTADVKSMQNHFLTMHQIKIKEYKCQQCGKISNSMDAHRYHLGSHGARIQCTNCDKTFTHRAGLLNHTLSVHKNQNKFPCQTCGKIFRWKASLKRHVTKHHRTDSTPPVEAFCSSCDITFASVSSYQRHLKNSLKHVSQDDLRFVCDDCNRRFADKTKLRDHIEEKHLHKTFECHICKKPSKNRVGLDQHIRNVHKGRPNNKICHHCGKGFPTRMQLESHIRSHTGERPFICEYCPTTFSQQSNLYKHNRQVHLNIKSKRNVKRKEEVQNEIIQERTYIPTAMLM